MKKQVLKFLLASAATLLVGLQVLTANATVVMELTFEELVAQSALIFTGAVQAVDITEADGLVYSTVTFAIETPIKGEPAGAEIALRFLGGNSAGLQVAIPGQDIPAPGDRGLWFVNDPQSDQVNPLTGWSQGYFPLLDADDGMAYLDLRDHPDYGLVTGREDPLATKMKGLGFSRESIQQQSPGSLEFPLADFIAAIVDVMDPQGATP